MSEMGKRRRRKYRVPALGLDGLATAKNEWVVGTRDEVMLLPSLPVFLLLRLHLWLEEEEKKIGTPDFDVSYDCR